MQPLTNFQLIINLLTQESIGTPTDFSPCRRYLTLQQNHEWLDNIEIQACACSQIENNYKRGCNVIFDHTWHQSSCNTSPDMSCRATAIVDTHNSGLLEVLELLLRSITCKATNGIRKLRCDKRQHFLDNLGRQFWQFFLNDGTFLLLCQNWG